MRVRFRAPRWATDDEALEVSGAVDAPLIEVIEESPRGSPAVVSFRVWCSRGGSAEARGDSAEDEWSADGTALATYGVTCRVEVPASSLKASWLRGACAVDVEAPSPISVQSWVLALHALEAVAPGEISPRNAYPLLAVGAALEAPGVEDAAARVAATTLTPQTFSRLVAYSLDRRRPLDACYARLKALGPALGFSNGHLLVGDGACDQRLFAPLVDAERERKTPFFQVAAPPLLRGVPVKVNNEDDKDLASSLAGVEERDDDDDGARKEVASHVFDPDLRRCYLVRRRAVDSANGDDDFALYDDATLELLVAARGHKGAASFVLSRARAGPSAPPRHTEPYLGEMVSHLGGSRFVLRDWGVDDLPPNCLPHLQRNVRAAVTYKTNVLGRVPNTMRVALVTADNNTATRFRTRKARWNERLQMWTLEFQERVKRASKKNFQLVQEDDDHVVKLLFGKVSKNRFSLDFAPPFAPATALAIALTTFASKLVAA
ncbi:hypothetical protein CTAYLR_004015 [Chrysophaeum taylorii]|uniref:Tubby C-terminal domain-containing protein n=1 Tax=Chrysophaeum taylorii TaxID=2483200 RepID=A0AAD7U7Z6_9STRA|nr:hypothetical protein CTAYLR_004015 [Chrysophaeum taylorii]